MPGLGAYVARLARGVFTAAILFLFLLIAISPTYFLGGLHIFGDIFVIFIVIFGLIMGYLVTWLAAGDFVVLNEWIAWSQNGLVFIIAGLSMGSSYMIVHGSIFGSIFPGCVVGLLITAIVCHVMLYGDQEVVNSLLRKLALQQCNVAFAIHNFREGNYSAFRVPLGMAFICLIVQFFGGSRLILRVKNVRTRTISPAPGYTSSASPGLGGWARLLFRAVVSFLFISFAISPIYFLGGLYFFGDISILLSIVIFGLLTGYLLAWIAEGDFVVLNQWIAWSQHGLVFFIITRISMAASHLIVTQSTYIYLGHLVGISIAAIVLYITLYGDQEVVYDVATKLMWQNVHSALRSFFDGHGAALFISSVLAIFCWLVKVWDVSRLILQIPDSPAGPVPVISTASASHSTSSVSPGRLVSLNTRQAREDPYGMQQSRRGRKKGSA